MSKEIKAIFFGKTKKKHFYNRLKICIDNVFRYV